MLGSGDEESTLHWGPDDWDLWLDRPRAPRAVPDDPSIAVREALDGLPATHRGTVADLGCGTGTWLSFLAERFERVVAVDYAPATLATARLRCVDPRVSFRRRDLRDLTPLRRTLDVAVALDSIVGPRTEDVDRILAQVHGGLVEGGILLATFPAASRDAGLRPVALAGDAPGSPDDLPLRFQELELQYRLRRAGFRGLRIRRVEPSLVCMAVRRANN